MKSREEREAIAREVYGQALDPVEFERRLELSRTPEQVAERKAQIAWFKKRYPTALERLRYVTERTRAWQGRK